MEEVRFLIEISVDQKMLEKSRKEKCNNNEELQEAVIQEFEFLGSSGIKLQSLKNKKKQ